MVAVTTTAVVWLKVLVQIFVMILLLHTSYGGRTRVTLLSFYMFCLRAQVWFEPPQGL
jgi:hypothetical protein